MSDISVAEVDRHRENIQGMEKRLERERLSGRDITIARIILMQHYAAYAAAMVRRNGGSLTEFKTLTDVNNAVPLCGSGRWARYAD
jgi:hypothetical protein